jgi:virginiamycin B lyase
LVRRLILTIALVAAGCGAGPQSAQVNELGARVAAGRDTHPTEHIPGPKPPPPVVRSTISSPYAIAAGADGVWFTEYSVAAIGELARDGTVKLVELDRDGFPERLTVARDGALWFTDPRGNRIGRIFSGGQRADYYPLPTPEAGPAGIAAAHDGAIWFTEHAAERIGMFVPPGADRRAPGAHGFKEFVLPNGGGPAGIVAVGDSVWFAENSSNKIGRLTFPADAAKPRIAEFLLPVPDSHPNGVAAAADGSVYFTELAANRIGRVTPQGRIEELVMPVNAPALDIAAGPDGAVWMTVPKAHALCRYRPGAPVRAFFLPQTATPAFITAGADGNLYFTEPSGKIGRFTPAGMLTEIETSGGENASAR